MDDWDAGFRGPQAQWLAADLASVAASTAIDWCAGANWIPLLLLVLAIVVLLLIISMRHLFFTVHHSLILQG